MYYMPMHAVHKEFSTTTKLRVVFDASAKTTSGSSLNDQFLVGPTVHSSLIDVLIRFRRHKIAMTTDVSKMYRAILLSKDQRDLHRFMWREDRTQPLRDYRMLRLTFGVSASSFAANMVLKQNALNLQQKYPRAAKAALECFYVDDGLVGADSVEEAICLQDELQHLFSAGGFTLRKWKTSDATVKENIPLHLRDQDPTQLITYTEVLTRVLGVEWDATTDTFKPLVPVSYEPGPLTKRRLLSEVAKLFDVLGWCSPAIIIPKMLIQRLWEEHLNWDELVSATISTVWEKWISKFTELRQCSISRSYFPKEVNMVTVQLHGFCDASEGAYAGAIYTRGIDTKGIAHISLVVAKTKVAPIKRLTIPRLELCGALIMARLLKHTSTVLNVPMGNVFAWTDSRVVLGWLRGDPRRFKVFVGNRVSEILELTPPSIWRHVSSKDNPADCASRGLYPDQLANHSQWWYGPDWLKQPENQWPVSTYEPTFVMDEERNTDTSRIVLRTGTQGNALSLLQRVSSYSRLIRVTSWIFRYVYNSRHHTRRDGVLSTGELKIAERFWLGEAQRSVFSTELCLIRNNKPLPRSSKLTIFHPFIDGEGLLRIGGRMELSKLSYTNRHPVLLPRVHRVVDLLIIYEHLRLLHAGPTLVSASLAQQQRKGPDRLLRSRTYALTSVDTG